MSTPPRRPLFIGWVSAHFDRPSRDESSVRTTLALEWSLWGAFVSLVNWWFLSGSAVLLCFFVIWLWWLAQRSWHLTGSLPFLAILSSPLLLLLEVVPALHRVDFFPWLFALFPLFVVGVAVTLLIFQRDARLSSLQRRIGAAVGLGALVAAALNAQNVLRTNLRLPSSDLRLTDIPGCYIVQRGLSFPPYRDQHSPPARVMLSAAKWQESEHGTGASHEVGVPYYDNYKMLAPDSVVGFWYPRSSEVIHVQWSLSGLVGFRGEVHRDGRDLVGRGEHFQDMQLPGPDPVMQFRMHAVDCTNWR